MNCKTGLDVFTCSPITELAKRIFPPVLFCNIVAADSHAAKHFISFVLADENERVLVIASVIFNGHHFT